MATVHSRLDHRHTIASAYVGYVTQAIINNLGPLFFVLWHDRFGISFAAIGLVVSLNFGLQLLVDLVAPRIIDAVGYRVSMCVAHVTAAVGLVAMGTLPFALPDPLVGILAATVICAVGGGLLEVLVSPVVEACPTENKAFHMSLAHSFYCWGHVAVVLLTTAAFALAGPDAWPLFCFAWAAVPLANAVLICFVPFYALVEDGRGMTYAQLFKVRAFWVFVAIMVAAGASEQAMSQWASAYAQAGLGLDKVTGDLLGPLSFAVAMGIARVVFGHRATVANVGRIMRACLVLCLAAYLLAALSPFAWLGLVGVALCGFSVGILWPGTFTLGSATFPRGGTALFALLAVGGDAGCAIGPAAVGAIADASGSLPTGLLAGAVFPAVMILLVWRLASRRPDVRPPAGLAEGVAASP